MTEVIDLVTLLTQLLNKRCTKFALFCYATKQSGGWADFDDFVFEETVKK